MTGKKRFISRRALAKYTVETGAERRGIRASKQQRNKALYEEKFTGEGT